MESDSLVQQGIAAYKAGNKAEAIRLLTEAVKQNRDDEEAWLYLGAAIDDPARKRQAFQQALRINPTSERAKNAMARLDADAAAQPASAAPAGGSGQSSGGGSSSGSAGASAGAAASSFVNSLKAIKFSFKLPVHVDGAPEVITSEYCFDNAEIRIRQVWDIFRNRNTAAHIAAAENATPWDSVFTVGIGVVAVALAEAFRLIGYLLGGEMFRHFPFSIIGVLLLTIFGLVIAAASMGAAFYAASAASQWYLRNEGVTVVSPQHNMYLALAFLPFPIVSAIVALLTNTIGRIVCLGPIGLLPIVALIYTVFILMDVFDQVYGGKEKNRGLITSVIAMVGGWFASVIVTVVLGIIMGILYLAFQLGPSIVIK